MENGVGNSGENFWGANPRELYLSINSNIFQQEKGMKKTVIGSVCAGLLMAGTAFASGHGAQWGYTGHKAAEYWGDLSPAYAICKKGLNQSPIDITNTIEANLPPLVFQYNTSTVDMIDNGHTVQVNYAPGSTLTVDGHTFQLIQFHFHTPSENAVDGNLYPMEAHLVHADAEGHLAVVAVFFEEGASNPLLDKLWPNMPTKVGETTTLADMSYDVNEMLPRDHSYYHFNGSLTTPPCSQGVYWFVLKTPATGSRAQFQKFHDVIGSDNNRPLQLRNARPVLR